MDAVADDSAGVVDVGDGENVGVGIDEGVDVVGDAVFPAGRHSVPMVRIFADNGSGVVEGGGTGAPVPLDSARGSASARTR